MSTADLAVVLVHYRTPELVEECAEALRTDLEAAGLEAEWLLVDNGSEPGEAEAFGELGLKVLAPGENLGYAGGVNLGAAESEAPVLLFLNPDVLVRPGCVPALLEELSAGAAAAGPRFSWDRGGRVLLPVNEPRTHRWELAAALAGRGGAWEEDARRTWRFHARRAWRAEEPFACHELSGALLAVRRDAWEQIGPFDDEYRLYFEETDWLERLRRAGLEARHVPAARAVHLYDQSGAREPRTAEWFAASQERFRDRFYGEGFRRVLERLEAEGAEAGRQDGEDGQEPSSKPPVLDLSSADDPLWVEISPSPRGFPYAAERLPEPGKTWTLPDGLWEAMRPGVYGLRVVRDGGRELTAMAFRRP